MILLIFKVVAGAKQTLMDRETDEDEAMDHEAAEMRASLKKQKCLQLEDKRYP